jgi:hypothetical protein
VGGGGGFESLWVLFSSFIFVAVFLVILLLLHLFIPTTALSKSLGFKHQSLFLTEQIDVTGNITSKKGLVDVYDIFGPAPQTLQGADALATALNSLVVVPDFFRGSYMEGEVSISLPLSIFLFCELARSLDEDEN